MTWVLDPGPEAPPTDGPPARPPIGRSIRGVAVVVLATAVVADLAIRSVAGGVAATAAVVVLAAGLATTGWVVRPGGRVLLAAAVVVSAFLSLRTDPWLVALDVGVVVVLVVLACTAERGARPFDTHFGATGRRLTTGLVEVASAAPDTVRLVRSLGPASTGALRRRAGAVARGLLLAVPLVAVIWLLLASADPVFGSVIDVGVDVTGLPVDLLLVVAAGWVATGCFVLASRPPVLRSERTAPIGPVEGIVVAGAMTAVYAVFAWTQVVVARRGPDYVVETTGLTYAEYARSGFFQLLWVAGLTAVALVSIRSLVRTDERWARIALAVLGAVVAALTLVVVRAAIVRLGLYEDAFGLTALRYWSTVVAWWLGSVFVVLGIASIVRAFGAERVAREWLPTAIGASALVAVLVLNLAVPHRTVAEHDLARAADGEELDIAYLATLSDDAVPTLVDAVPTLPIDQGRELANRLCRRDRSGPMTWNRAQRDARAALDELCS